MNAGDILNLVWMELYPQPAQRQPSVEYILTPYGPASAPSRGARER